MAGILAGKVGWWARIRLLRAPGDIFGKIGGAVEKWLDQKIKSGRIKLLLNFDEIGIKDCNCLWLKELSSRKGHDF